MRIVSGIALTTTLLAAAASPAAGQTETWQNRWYWGAHGGGYRFSTIDATGTSSWQTAWFAGGHWFITKRAAGLYVGFDEIIFPDGTTTTVQNAAGTTLTSATFTRGQRIQAMLYAVPGGKNLQFRLGGGFALNHLNDAAVSGTVTSGARDAVEEASSDSFFVLGAGFQFLMGRFALFGDYHYMPGAAGFLIQSEQHAFFGGLRFALASSSTEVTTER
jgi:hypothetical protein